MKSLVLGKRPSRKKVAFFNPKEMFSFGEQGVWYDPSDLTTMFQDSAGTTPVTAVEQPVGLLLDKSKGLALGPELVTNGDFSNGSTGYVEVLNGTISYATGAMVATGITGNTGVYQDVPVVSGKSYQVSWLIGTSTNWRINIYNGASFTTSLYNNGTGSSSSGAFTAVVFPTTTAIRIYAHTGTGTVATFDNISVKELAGNHATQGTSASRPVLSARVNLLTKTEQFNDAVWSTNTGSVIITANSAGTLAPDKTQTADLMTEATGFRLRTGFFYSFVTALTSTTYTYSICIKQNAGSRFVRVVLNQNSSNIFACVDINPSTGAITQTLTAGAVTNVSSSVTSEGNGWYRVSITGTQAFQYMTVAFVTSATTPAGIDFGYESFTGSTSNSIYIWGADLRVTNDGVGIPAYQRVNTSTDYDTTGFPYYLRFDGTDDSMATGTITPGIDKVQAFSGVRKLSDAAIAVAAELGTGGAAGSFFIAAPRNAASANYGFSSSGTLSSDAISGISWASPVTSVLTGNGDISGDIAILRVNGTQVATSGSDQGTGNYGNYSLYIGRRAGTSLPFNGRIYSLIVRFGANLSTNEIKQMETWVAKKTGVSL